MNDPRTRDALVVIGRLSYPNSSAAVNRVHLYCKALKLEKGFPFVINLHSTFTQPQYFNYLGRHEGIPFYYSQKTVVRETRLIKRNFNKVKGVINSFIIVMRIKKHHNFKVLFYGTTVWDEFVLFIFLKLLGVSVIRECSEIPYFIKSQTKLLQLHTFLLKLKLKMYGQLIVISDYLKNYYSGMFPNENIFQIPILVDMERFDGKFPQEKRVIKVISYVGAMEGNKDGLENLIQAVALVKEKKTSIQLDLVGSAPHKDLLRLKNKVSTLGLNDIVNFRGKKTAKEIPFILLNSDLLVLARPDNSQAKAGFPTKLGEYLASKIPVVITITGEIPKYLKDNVSAYLAKPDDINDFAEKILFALSDAHSPQIGERGYQIAKNNFNYQLYGAEILKIIQD